VSTILNQGSFHNPVGNNGSLLASKNPLGESIIGGGNNLNIAPTNSMVPVKPTHDLPKQAIPNSAK
jgi:hypothetical protein